MKKNQLIVGIFILVSVLLISGCTEQNNDNDAVNDNEQSEPKTVTMDLVDYQNDLEYDFTVSGMTSNFKSLNDGDTLIIQDKISSISYDETTDITTITMENDVTGEAEMSETFSISLIFEGDISNKYTVGDEIKVTLKIKHIAVTIEEMSLDLEIYEEYWVNEQYFIDNYMSGNYYKPISPDKITKV